MTIKRTATQQELLLPTPENSESQLDLFDRPDRSIAKQSRRSRAWFKKNKDQFELSLEPLNPLAESPEPTPQTIFEGMEKPIFEVAFADGRNARFQHANTLLESLEAQDIHIEYQCREGYCGSCRVRLVEGDVHYIEEPMAWIDDDEILPCCCIPKSALKLQ